MKNRLNVWYWEAVPKYYLLHPWKWFIELGQNIRNSYNRITKGYCCLDWFNFDAWFKFVAPPMLREMAMHGHVYPGTEPFETPEKWRSWLHRMADQLEYCQDEDNGNEYYKPYIEMLERTGNTEKTEEDEELGHKYYERSKEVSKKHEIVFKETMKELVEHWDCLWD